MKHRFCRLLLAEVMKDVRLAVDRITIAQASAWKTYAWGQTAEFRIAACPRIPGGYYWCGQADCRWEARAKGWTAFLEIANGEAA